MIKMNDDQISEVNKNLLLFFEKYCQKRNVEKVIPDNYTFFCRDLTNSSCGHVEAYVYVNSDKKYLIQIEYEGTSGLGPQRDDPPIEKINCDNLVEVFQNLSDLHIPDPTTSGHLYFELLPPFKDRFERYHHYSEKKTLNEIYSTYYSNNFDKMLNIIKNF
jgi:hypothetical protein